jgi:hypothetical protein
MAGIKDLWAFWGKKWTLDLVSVAKFQEYAYKFALPPWSNKPIKVQLNVKRTEAQFYD